MKTKCLHFLNSLASSTVASLLLTTIIVNTDYIEYIKKYFFKDKEIVPPCNKEIKRIYMVDVKVVTDFGWKEDYNYCYFKERDNVINETSLSEIIINDNVRGMLNRKKKRKIKFEIFKLQYGYLMFFQKNLYFNKIDNITLILTNNDTDIFLFFKS